MIYMGTVSPPEKRGQLFTAIGMKTELGQIAGKLARHESDPTPLQRRLAELWQSLDRHLPGHCSDHLRFTSMERRQGIRGPTGPLVSLAVAAVPEGLPAVVTIALALARQRMAKRNA